MLFFILDTNLTEVCLTMFLSKAFCMAFLKMNFFISGLWLSNRYLRIVFTDETPLKLKKRLNFLILSLTECWPLNKKLIIFALYILNLDVIGKTLMAIWRTKNLINTNCESSTYSVNMKKRGGGWKQPFRKQCTNGT